MIAYFGSLAVGALIYFVDAPQVNILKVQLCGDAQVLPLPSGTEEAVLRDFAFIVSYLVALWLAARLACALFRGSISRLISQAIWPLSLVSAGADVIENSLVLLVVRVSMSESNGRGLLEWVRAAATVKFLCWVPVMIVGLVAVVMGGRYYSANRRRRPAH